VLHALEIAWKPTQISRIEERNVSMREIYKHPDIARKNKTEAKSAEWR